MGKLGFKIHQDQHPYCCGVDNLGGFTNTAPFWVHDDGYGSVRRLHKSGTGLYTAEFIDNDACKAAYKWLCSKKTLLFQTEVKKNSGHNNGGMFMCVFQDKKGK